MHYRNGREAKNGDKVVQLSTCYNETDKLKIVAVGVLYDAKPGADYCNGTIAPILGGHLVTACLCDCLHMDDLSDLISEAGLHKRPAGK